MVLFIELDLPHDEPASLKVGDAQTGLAAGGDAKAGTGQLFGAVAITTLMLFRRST